MSTDARTLANDVILQVEEALKSQGMTKADLAVAMDVTPGYVSHLLVGRKKNLTIETLAKLANALGMDLAIEFTGGRALTGVVPAAAVEVEEDADV